MAKPAKETFRKIVISYLEKRHGKLDIINEGRNELWEFNSQKYKPHYCTDKESRRFTGVALSPASVESMINNQTYFMPIQYFQGDGNKFRIYSIQPELILEHYVNDANVEPKKGTNSFHITIRHENDKLIFTRRGTSEISIPTDKENYCSYHEMSEEKYTELKNVLGIREEHDYPVETKKTLKVVVSGKKGSENFSITSAKVIAILSLLSKSKKPLSKEEILEGIIQYGVLTRGKNEIDAIKRALRKLVLTGGIVTLDEGYSISDKIEVEVAL